MQNGSPVGWLWSGGQGKQQVFNGYNLKDIFESAVFRFYRANFLFSPSRHKYRYYDI